MEHNQEATALMLLHNNFFFLLWRHKKITAPIVHPCNWQNYNQMGWREASTAPASVAAKIHHSWILHVPLQMMDDFCCTCFADHTTCFTSIERETHPDSCPHWREHLWDVALSSLPCAPVRKSTFSPPATKSAIFREFSAHNRGLYLGHNEFETCETFGVSPPGANRGTDIPHDSKWPVAPVTHPEQHGHCMQQLLFFTLNLNRESRMLDDAYE